MGAWGWIVLSLLLFSVAQLLVYRYVRNETEEEEEETPLLRSTPVTRDRVGIEEIGRVENRARVEDHERNDRQRDDSATNRVERDASSVAVCPRCGTENETGYTYCRNCVSPMTVR